MKNVSRMKTAYNILIGAEATPYALDAANYVQEFWRKQAVPVPSVETMLRCQDKNKYTLTIVMDSALNPQCVVETYALRTSDAIRMLTGEISETEIPLDAFVSYSPYDRNWTLYSAILCDQDKAPSDFLAHAYAFAGVVGAAKTIEVAYLLPHQGRSVNINCFGIDATDDGKDILSDLQFTIDPLFSKARAEKGLQENVWTRRITNTDIKAFWYSIRNNETYAMFADHNSFIFKIG